MSTDQTRDRADGIPPITVVGVGGGGCNAVNRMIEDGIRGVEFVAVNTDNQQLGKMKTDNVIPIADEKSKGLGVGGDPERGARAAENSRGDFRERFDDVDMVFIAAGMGGGTGTGAAPIVAEEARKAGALTIAVVSRPWEDEGEVRAVAADLGIQRLNEVADTVIVIPNDRLSDPNDRSLTMAQAFANADDVLRQAVQGISDVIVVPGEINLDFNDVKKIMGEGGHALMGLGRGSGDDRAQDALDEAMYSPLLEDSIDGATKVLFNVTTNGDLRMFEHSLISKAVREQLHPSAEIIMGTAIDESLDGELHITLIATGFGAQTAALPVPVAAAQQLTRPAAQTAPRPEPLANFTYEPAPLPSDEQISTPAFIRQGQASFNLEPGAQAGDHRNRPGGNGRWDPSAAIGE